MSTEDKKYSQQLNILTYVLEDDEDIIYLLDRLFKANNFVDYSFFKNTDEFLQNLNERVHICVIDYYLPGPLNGLDVMKLVLTQNPWCEVIMISGQDNLKVVIDFINNGGFRYVNKNDSDYMRHLVDFIQQSTTRKKKQLDMQLEFKSVYEDLKTKKKKVET